MITLGKDVYYFEPKTKEIKSGVVVGANISDTGYILYSILPDQGQVFRLEEKHIHLTKDSAEQHAIEKTPIIQEADRIIKEATEKVNKLRLQVIGEPDYIIIAEKIIGGNNGQ